MSKEFQSYEKEKLSFKEKFYLLMDLLVTHQSISRGEITIFFFIFYSQFITGFFSTEINILQPTTSSFDQLLNLLEKVLRVIQLVQFDLTGFKVVVMLLFAFIVLSMIYFLIIIFYTTKSSFYSIREALLNFIIKLFLYIAFHISLSFAFISFCLESAGNPFFQKSSCTIIQDPVLFTIALLLFLFSIVYYFFIQTFYYNCFILSHSLYSRSTCNYDYYMGLHTLCYTICLTQVKMLTTLPFLLYNLVVSFILCYYYFYVYLFFDYTTNATVGLFHVLYAWASFFFLLFNFITLGDKGLVFCLLSLFLVYYYFVKKFSIEKSIIYKTPYFQITNTFHLVFYVKTLIDKINVANEDDEERSLLIGILQMHIKECPNPNCLTKHTDPIYLPLSNEWSQRDKPMISDPIFLNMFIIVVYNFFLSLNYYSADMMINVSLYYLISIGNLCQSIYFYNKAKEMKMTYKEQFSFKRLGITIAKSLAEKFKMQNEACFTLEDLNTSLYFRYEEISFQLLKELSNDVEQNTEFWRTLKQGKCDILDFNDIFYLVDKIRLSKIQVEVLFKKLFEIFTGVNDLFDLYLNYVETINDDDVLKRDLETIKRKSDTTAEMIHFNNYYTILFNKETGIIIANGDKGKEGLIEKTNRAADAMFGYEAGKLKGLNVSSLMPKVLKNKHKSFMEHYFQIGEKRIIDQRDFKTYGKDKDNAIFVITLIIKLFPILNDNIYFVSLILKEKIDDIILTDNKFNIQGMSQQLMNKLFIENKQLFQLHDIPFYVICKQFVHFYKNFLQKKALHKRQTNKLTCYKLIESSTSLINASSLIGLASEDEVNNLNVDENVEINENVELEYSIRIPQFITDYMTQENQSEKQGLEENFLTIEEGEEDISFDEDDNENNEDISEADEKKPIINNNNNASITKNDRIALSIKKSAINSSENNKAQCGSLYKTLNKSAEKKVSEAEKNFQKSLEKFQKLFQSGLFHDLEEYINSFFDTHYQHEYKFNFTFNRFRYGNKEVAYVIRCIDNKTETDLASESLDSMKENTFLQKTKKENYNYLRKTHEHFFDERDAFIIKHQEYLRMSLEDPAFQVKLTENKEDIIRMSRIFGIKKTEAVLDDENSSQSSQAGYNEDLSKKNRIEEIRKGVMKKVSDFYILKYYRINALLTLLFTLALSLYYILELYSIIFDLEIILDLYNKLYQKTNWITSLLSTLLSLKAMYTLNQIDHPLTYASFLEDKRDLVNLFKNSSIKWSQSISSSFGMFESQIAKYLGNRQEIFWGNLNLFVESSTPDEESFPLALEQIIGNINALLYNDLFFKRIFEKEEGDLIANGLLDYHLAVAITNTYHAFLSIDFDKLSSIPTIFAEYNRSKVNKHIDVMIYYCALLAASLICYSILIFCTNRRIGEGFEKVAKIKPERIDDVIMKIASFQVTLKRYQEFSLNEEKGTLLSTTSNNEDEKNPHSLSTCNKLESIYNIDNNKDIKLNLLSVSYLQVLFLAAIVIGFIVPICTMLSSLIQDTNTLFLINKYIFGNLIMTTGSLIELKAIVTGFKSNTYVNYSSLLGGADLKDIVVSMQGFGGIMDYFNQMKVDLCNSTYLFKDSPEYIACTNDPEIKVLNNTMAIIQMVNKKVGTLLLDIENHLEENPLKVFNSSDYSMIEKRHFYFVIPISDNVALISKETLTIKLNDYRNKMFLLFVLFSVCMALDFLFVWIFFIRRIIHLLSVSRCVLKVIPIIIINNTQEIVSWIENME